MFFKIDAFFKNPKIHLEVKPAIGGLLVGIIALLFPHALGSGYARLQNILLGIYERGTLSLPLILALLLLPFLKMFDIVLTLGSGGSSGVFAPGMVIGGFIDAFYGYVMKTLMPLMVASVVPFVIVGMRSFFGTTGKISLSIILMVIEMTRSLHVVPYAMISNAIATLVTGNKTIYPSQKHRREKKA